MPCGCVLLAYLGLPILDGSPRTLSIEIDSWTNRSWGFHRIERTRVRCNVAVARDGSRATECEDEGFRHYFFPGSRARFRTLYVHSEHSAFRLDHERRIAIGGPCPCTWETLKLQPPSDRCALAAGEILGAEARHKDTGSVAGQVVHRYSRIDEDTGRITAAAFAPAADCELMEQIVTWPGTFGIPGARWRYVVRSYVPGDPAPERFTLPAGFSIERKERHLPP